MLLFNAIKIHIKQKVCVYKPTCAFINTQGHQQLSLIPINGPLAARGMGGSGWL